MLLHFCTLGVTRSWDDGFLGARASRPHQSLAQPRPSPPLGSTGNGAMALLRPGRCCSRRQGGCLQHRTEAQRRPKGQDAGGTPALPGNAVPAVWWGVSGGRLLRKPTCTLWETPVCPPAVPLPPDRADHPRVKQVLFQIRVKQVLFQTSQAPAPHDGADHSRVKQVLFQASRAPAPTTVRITQRKNSRSSMKTNHQ